jgi:AcrR family transcriptional regulator
MSLPNAAREPRRRAVRAAGERSRRQVLRQAARLATIDGLDGLSVGRLAEASGMPKSSVYQLFGSKEDIQLATIDTARESFIAEVVAPALAGREGRARLLALCLGYLSYVERRVFPGGCFFVGAAAEVGGRPGRIHDRVAAVQMEWRDLLLHEARSAHDRAELLDGADPDQLAFELAALLAGTNVVSVLHDDQGLIERARSSVHARLGAG